MQNVASSTFCDHFSFVWKLKYKQSNATDEVSLNAFQKKVIAKSWSRDSLHWMEIGVKPVFIRRNFARGAKFFFVLWVSRVELIRKDKENFRSARRKFRMVEKGLRFQMACNMYALRTYFSCLLSIFMQACGNGRSFFIFNWNFSEYLAVYSQDVIQTLCDLSKFNIFMIYTGQRTSD